MSSPSVAPFVGPLDDYTAGAGLYSVGRRLLASYTGPLIKVRRSSDSAEKDIYPTSTGLLDVADLDAWRAGSDWFFRRVYDETGLGRDLVQNSASAQPQGGVDGNGIAYAFNPYASSGAVSFGITGLGLAITDTTQWSVGSAAAFFYDMFTIVEGTGNRRLVNVANALFFDPPGGSDAGIGSTTTGLYSVIGQISGTGNRLTNGLASGTGTATAATTTASSFQAGATTTGAPQWAQNSKWYAGGVWTADLGNSAVDALQTIVRALFHTL